MTPTGYSTDYKVAVLKIKGNKCRLVLKNGFSMTIDFAKYFALKPPVKD